MTQYNMQLFISAGKQAAGGLWGNVAKQLTVSRKGLADATKFVGSNVAPAALGSAAGYGTYHAAVPEGATTAQKVEGAIAAGLAGVGASGFGRANTWRNVLQKARAQDAASVAKGMRPDLTKYVTSNALSDVVAPKLKFLGASMVPVGLSQAQSAVSNLGRATGNVAGVTDKWKELADQAAAKDQSGKSIVEKVRDAVNKVTTDAEGISGTLAQGTTDITGSVTDAAKNIGGSLTDASKSFAGATEGVKSLTETIKPVAEEFTKKDDRGNTVFSNLNRLFSNANDGIADFKNMAAKNINKFDRLGSIAQYTPYLAAGGLTAGGLYGLYRLMNSRRARKARNDEE